MVACVAERWQGGFQGASQLSQGSEVPREKAGAVGRPSKSRGQVWCSASRKLWSHWQESTIDPKGRPV